MSRLKPRTLLFALILVLIAAFAPTLAQDDGKAATPPTDKAAAPDAAKDAKDAKATGGDSAATSADGDAAEEEEGKSLAEQFNAVIEKVNGAVATVMFFDVSFGVFDAEQLDDDGEVVIDKETGKPEIDDRPVPFMVILLASGAVFFTFWHGWINLRGFKHAVDVVRGKFSSKSDPGDVTPFRALTSALSATVGLGNIAGVAIAVKTGGPGAIFWMMFLGLFGMTAKFHESTLAQIFRKQNPDGTISGGPMYYLDEGIAKEKPALAGLGRVLAIIFAVFCIGAALGGGNMFQSNQAFEGFHSQFVAEPTLAQEKRAEMPIDQLRPLLTEKQLKAVRRVDETWAEHSLEEIRAGISEKRVRDIVTSRQVEHAMLAPIIRPLLTDEQLEAARSDEQKEQETDLETVRAELKHEAVVAAANKRQKDAAEEETGIAKDRAEYEATKNKVSIGFGLIMAVIVGVVVVGGITRIGAATSKIVPTMCLLYVFGCLVIIIANVDQIPSHIGLIVTDAFAWQSAWGGLVGVLVIGFQRAAFSSEAGLGSSAIAHSAAQTNEPVREGFVASLEPFIDTIIICFMTAMVVLITDAYIAPELALEENGAAVTLFAFQQTRVQWLAAWFPAVLSISIILFAFSTMISWCYYGERAYGYLLGLRSVVVFRLAFVICVFIGAVASLGPVLDFADLMLLSMAFPNIIGGVILAGLVKRRVKDYWGRYRSGAMAQAGDAGDGGPSMP